MGMNKFKLKALVAAIALGATAQANAILIDGSTGDGELFLSVWDTVAKVGYVKDTGITMSAYAASVGGLNFNLNTDANWNTFKAASTTGNTVWNIGALDSTGGTAPGGQHYLATSTNTAAQIRQTQTNTQVVGMAGSNSYVSALNSLGGTSTIFSATNGSAYVTAADGFAFPGTAGGYWDNNFGTKAQGWTTTAGLDIAMNLYQLTPSTSLGINKATVTQCGYADISGVFQACSFTLTSAGTTTFTGVPAVPVPAALWLLGSALVGLVGVARRKVA